MTYGHEIDDILGVDRTYGRHWATIFKACELSLDDLALGIDTGIMTKADFLDLLEHEPNLAGLVMLLSLHPDAPVLATELVHLAAQREHTLRSILDRLSNQPDR